VAAAIRARAQLIVTANVRDFPAEALARWDVEAISPDDFVRALSAGRPRCGEAWTHRDSPRVGCHAFVRILPLMVGMGVHVRLRD
jgi:hypothetical protein